MGYKRCVPFAPVRVFCSDSGTGTAGWRFYFLKTGSER